MVEQNKNRIKAYCECVAWVIFAYVMRKNFNWGNGRISELHRKFLDFNDKYFLAGIRDKREYLRIEWLWDGLKEECGYEYIRYVPVPPPDNFDGVQRLISAKSSDLSIAALEYLETIWLWVLHVDFGFGGQRLKKCRDEVLKINPLEAPAKLIFGLMADMEKYRGGREQWQQIRERFTKLDVNHDNFATGLTLFHQGIL